MWEGCWDADDGKRQRDDERSADVEREAARDRADDHAPVVDQEAAPTTDNEVLLQLARTQTELIKMVRDLARQVEGLDVAVSEVRRA